MLTWREREKGTGKREGKTKKNETIQESEERTGAQRIKK